VVVYSKLIINVITFEITHSNAMEVTLYATNHQRYRQTNRETDKYDGNTALWRPNARAFLTCSETQNVQ